MVNYEELDGILDTVEEVFLALTVELGLKQTSIERWRWDEPVITLTWVGSDDISRNIHALIIPEGSFPYKLLVEGNAWQDKDEVEGRIRVRKWQHVEIDREVSPDRSELRRAIDKAYSKVSEWRSTEDLKGKAYLVPWTAGLGP